MVAERLKILGARIRELREGRNLTQTQLADLADLSTNYLGEIERGQAQATLESLFAVIDALEVNPSLRFTPPDQVSDRRDIIRRIRELLDVLSESD